MAVLTAFAILVVASAGAEVRVPILVGTTPESPGVSIHPLVYGRVNGVITSSLPRALRLQAVRSGVGGPTVSLYADSECDGTPLASGSGEQFEAQGIEITVAPNVTTTIYADETDGVETSDCSGGLSYKQVSAPPAAPTVSSVSPASPANDNFPLVGGSAEDGATVGLYDNAACSGHDCGMDAQQLRMLDGESGELDQGAGHRRRRHSGNRCIVGSLELRQSCRHTGRHQDRNVDYP